MSYLYVYVMCATAMGWISEHERTPERRSTCIALGTQAIIEDLPADLAIALAFTESRFSTTATSSVGAAGPFQIVPRFHCPGRKLKGCDLITEGLRTLKRYRKRYKRWRDALCHWNSGNRCYTGSRRFARIVLRRKRLLTRALGDKHGHQESHGEESGDQKGAREGTGEEGDRKAPQAR